MDKRIAKLISNFDEQQVKHFLSSFSLIQLQKENINQLATLHSSEEGSIRFNHLRTMDNSKGQNKMKQDVLNLRNLDHIKVEKLLKDQKGEIKNDKQELFQDAHLSTSPLQRNKRCAKKPEGINDISGNYNSSIFAKNERDQDKTETNNSLVQAFKTVENDKNTAKKDHHSESNKKSSLKMIDSHQVDQSYSSSKMSQNTSANVTFYPKQDDNKNNNISRRSQAKQALEEIKDNFNTTISDYDTQSRVSRKQSTGQRVHSLPPPPISPTQNQKNNKDLNIPSPRISDQQAKYLYKRKNRIQPLRMSQHLEDAISECLPYNKTKQQQTEGDQWQIGDKYQTNIPLKSQLNQVKFHNLFERNPVMAKKKESINFQELDRLSNHQFKEIPEQQTKYSIQRSIPTPNKRHLYEYSEGNSYNHYDNSNSNNKQEVGKLNSQLYISVEQINHPEQSHPFYSETKNRLDETMKRVDLSSKKYSEISNKKKNVGDSLNPSPIYTDQRKNIIGNTNSLDTNISRSREAYPLQDDRLFKTNQAEFEQKMKQTENNQADARELIQLQQTFSATDQKKKNVILPQLDESKRKSIPNEICQTEGRYRYQLNSRAHSLQAKSKIPNEMQCLSGAFQACSTLHNTPAHQNEQIIFNPKNFMKEPKLDHSQEILKTEIGDSMLEETGRFGQEEYEPMNKQVTMNEKQGIASQQLSNQKKNSLSSHLEQININNNPKSFIPTQIASLIMASKIPKDNIVKKIDIPQEYSLPTYQLATLSTKIKTNTKMQVISKNEPSTKAQTVFSQMAEVGTMIATKQQVETPTSINIPSSNVNQKQTTNLNQTLTKPKVQSTNDPRQGTLLINYNFPSQMQNKPQQQLQQQQQSQQQSQPQQQQSQIQQPPSILQFNFQQQQLSNQPCSVTSKKVQSAEQASRKLNFYPQILSGGETDNNQLNAEFQSQYSQQIQQRAKSSNNRFPREIFTPNVQKAKRLNSQNNQSGLYKNNITSLSQNNEFI